MTFATFIIVFWSIILAFVILALIFIVLEKCGVVRLDLCFCTSDAKCSICSSRPKYGLEFSTLGIQGNKWRIVFINQEKKLFDLLDRMYAVAKENGLCDYKREFADKILKPVIKDL